MTTAPNRPQSSVRAPESVIRLTSKFWVNTLSGSHCRPPAQSRSRVTGEGVEDTVRRMVRLEAGRMCIVPEPYPKEFRHGVVNVARDRKPGQTIKQIAADFGIAESCVRQLDGIR